MNCQKLAVHHSLDFDVPNCQNQIIGKWLKRNSGNRVKRSCKILLVGLTLNPKRNRLRILLLLLISIQIMISTTTYQHINIIIHFRNLLFTLPICFPTISPKELIICMMTSPWPKANGMAQKTKTNAMSLNRMLFSYGEGISSYTK